MNKQKNSSKKFKYVYRKDLGYYTVSTDDPYWDKEKKQMRHRYTLVGKSMSKGGPIEYGAKYRSAQAQKQLFEGLHISKSSSIGELLVLEQMYKHLQLLPLLTKAVGSDDVHKVLSLAAYSVCSGEPLSLAGPWFDSHGLENLGLDAPRISELLLRLTPDVQNKFFSPWLKKKAAGGTLCYDITSLSSYGKNNHLIEYGYNRDKEKLEQINLALLSGRTSGLPVWYTPLPGSLNDSKTLKGFIRELQKLEVSPFSFIMDRGFYSKENRQFLNKKNIKFMIPVPNRVSWHKKIILEKREQMFSNVDGYIPSEDGSRLLQSLTVYTPMEDGARAWLHIYYDSDIRAHAEQQFMAEYRQRFQEFSRGALDPAYQDYYDRYFTRGYKTKNGQKVIAKADPVALFKEDISGYWCIYTTAEKDARKALDAYRERNEIELLFDDLKNALDCNRLRVHSKPAMDGRLFIQFIALIILTELKHQIRDHSEELSKYGNYRSILKRVASFSRISFEGKYKDLYSAPTKGQEVIFSSLGVDYPQHA
jgi:hypothetical protein